MAVSEVVSEVDKELIRYFIHLTEPQKQSLLQLIKTFMKPGIRPIEKVTVEQYNKELDDAMTRMNKGDFTTLEELEKEMQ